MLIEKRNSAVSDSVVVPTPAAPKRPSFRRKSVH